MADKKTIKSVGDIEREKMLGRNDFNQSNEYEISKTYLTNGGNDNDNAQRVKQMSRGEFNANNEYGIDKVDL